MVHGFHGVQYWLLDVRLLAGDPRSTLGRNATFLLLDLVTSERKVLAGRKIKLRLLAVNVCHQIVHGVAKAPRSHNLTPGLKPSNRALLLFLAGSCLFLLKPEIQLGNLVGIGIVSEHAIDPHHLFLLIGLHQLKVSS